MLAKQIEGFQICAASKKDTPLKYRCSLWKIPWDSKELGPEMKSTGEAIYFIDDLHDEYFQNVYRERNLYLSK